MTKPTPIYDKPHGSCLIDGTVINIYLFIMVPSKRQIPWGLSYMGVGFVIYRGCPQIEKSHPLVTNPNPPQWLVKIWSKFLTNERPGNWSCDAFWTNHKALFHDFKVLRGTQYKNISLGFVIYGEKICRLWGVSPFWQIPPTFDKPQSSSVGSQNYKKFFRPMRGLEIDHVTPFRPITRLYFRILKVLRGTPYKNISLGFVIYGGGVCQYWQIPPTCDKPQASSVGSQISLGFVIYGGGICLFDVPVRDIYISRTGTSKRQIPRGFVTYGEKH